MACMSRRLLAFIAVVAVLVAAAALTNPSPERHRARLKEAVAERSPIAGALGLGALQAFTSTYHPLGVASYTTVGERVASVGAFGVVVVLEAPARKE